MSQRNRDLVLLSWPAASFVTVRTVLPCLVNVWFMWNWTPQGDRPVIPKNASSQLPLVVGEVCSSIHHFSFHQTKWWVCLLNVSICPWLALSASAKTRTNAWGRQGISFECYPISFSKRNDQWWRTLLSYGTIHLLGNSENGLQKYLVNDWPFLLMNAARTMLQ